jgi:hypothetical protein
LSATAFHHEPGLSLRRAADRAARVAELLAFLLCLVGLVFAGPQAGTETRAAESTVDAEEVTSERDEDDDAVVALPKAGAHDRVLSWSLGRPPSSDADARGFGAPLLAGAPPACALPFSLNIAGAAHAPRAWLAQAFLAPVRPRGPTLFA